MIFTLNHEQTEVDSDALVVSGKNILIISIFEKSSN